MRETAGLGDLGDGGIIMGICSAKNAVTKHRKDNIDLI